jgi:hypothetical protein
MSMRTRSLRYLTAAGLLLGVAVGVSTSDVISPEVSK